MTKPETVPLGDDADPAGETPRAARNRRIRRKRPKKPLTTMQVISSLMPGKMTKTRRGRAWRKLKYRCRFGGGMVPGYIWLMWRHGYDSDGYMHRAYAGAEILGGGSAILGVVSALDGNIDTNLSFDPNSWAFWAIGAGIMSAYGAWRLDRYTREEAMKIRGYMESYNVHGKTDKLDSLVASGRIDKPAQAMLLGRGIHDVGYQLFHKLKREQFQAQVERAYKGTSVDQVPTTFTEENIKEVLGDWFLLTSLTSLARRAGLAPDYSKSGIDIKMRYEKPLHAMMSDLFTRAGRIDLIEQLDGEPCRAIRGRVIGARVAAQNPATAPC